jgi:DNA invertase Pin-like site-specific DNA recombinase
MTKNAPRRAALYLRVSTNDQTTNNQRVDLEAWAERSGLIITHVFEDAGISGAKRRSQRPQLDAMLKAASRREFDILCAWSVDRIGRSLPDLLSTLEELHASNVDLYLAKQAIDTRTPAGRALFGMLGVFAEFERSLIVERTRAGLARARREGKKLGRPMLSIDVRNRIRALRRDGLSQVAIAHSCNVSRFAVQAELKRANVA